jgi:hypothetical protein
MRAARRSENFGPLTAALSGRSFAIWYFLMPNITRIEAKTWQRVFVRLNAKPPDVSLRDVSLPIAGEVNRLATLHRQRGNAAHLIPIRDAAVIFPP